METGEESLERPAREPAARGRGLRRARARRATAGRLVNDIHSRLNPTRVARVVAPDSLAALQAAVRAARDEGQSISVAGGRHAMGGQQFASGSVLLDTRRLSRVLRFDPARARVEVEAGFEWPELVAYTARAQEGRAPQVGIRQKQTGADRLSVGGALAANIHGRGLTFKPFVADVESFVLVCAGCGARTCSRGESRALCGRAGGGRGVFGAVGRAGVRPAPRRKLRRVVRIAEV